MALKYAVHQSQLPRSNEPRGVAGEVRLEEEEEVDGLLPVLLGGCCFSCWSEVETLYPGKACFKGCVCGVYLLLGEAPPPPPAPLASGGVAALHCKRE